MEFGLLFICIVIAAFWGILGLLRSSNGSGRKRVAVVVLGDIGRSPRMQYHSLSLANSAGLDVDLIGYGGSEPLNAITTHKHIRQHLIKPFSMKIPRVFILIYAPFKIVWLAWQLLWTLLTLPRPDYVLMQNPPAIPALLVVRLAGWARKTKVVIDWHNFGYTILRMSVPRSLQWVSVIAEWYERALSRGAYANFCVTEAMKDWLECNWNVRPMLALHDKPPPFFRSTTLEERHAFFTNKAGEEFAEVARKMGMPCSGTASLFTERTATGKVVAREGRPGLVVSSTSWTADEDFGMLLKAILRLESAAAKHKDFPQLVFVITGKGPMKEYYLNLIAEHQLQHIHVLTMWLPAEDYPVLLGSCDLGVSLHSSSSGLDLPMKVVDMFGCGLPVCALSFNCLEELVVHETNGLTFNNDAELAEHLLRLFRGFPSNSAVLDRLRDGVKKFQAIRWGDSWDAIAKPVFS